LNRFLAQAGLASRRRCEDLIAAGRVRVNGQIATTPAVSIDPERDEVECDGQRVRLTGTFRYLVLNKPPGVITTLHDPQGRRTVRELIPREGRLYPVGRLDADTTGLLLLTDDGDLAFRVMHPRHGLKRTYLALVEGFMTAGTLARLERGVELDDGPARALDVRRVASDGMRSVIRLSLGEGRKREVRRLCRQVGHAVVALHRESLGPIVLGAVAEGSTRELQPEELAALRGVLGFNENDPAPDPP
jgi:23S rRNA pseudouridine2605 synthase